MKKRRYQQKYQGFAEKTLKNAIFLNRLRDGDAD